MSKHKSRPLACSVGRDDDAHHLMGREVINVAVEYEDILRKREVQRFAMECSIVSEHRVDSRQFAVRTTPKETRET